MLAATLLVLLVASINYQLNLGYLLTFLLAGSAVVGMHVCHAHAARPDAAPDAARAAVRRRQRAASASCCTTTRKRVRYGIGLAVLTTQRPLGLDRRAGAGQQPRCRWPSSRERRGLHRVPPLTAETRFPLGTFRVWTVWRPAAQVLVYPAPEPHPPPLPPGEPRAGGARGRAQRTARGEFDGVRAYRRGDPLKLVVWKRAAERRPPAPTNWSAATRSRRSARALARLRQAAGLPDTGSTGCRACAPGCCRPTGWAWTTACACRASEITPASGEAHKRRCLEALAAVLNATRLPDALRAACRAKRATRCSCSA